MHIVSAQCVAIGRILSTGASRNAAFDVFSRLSLHFYIHLDDHITANWLTDGYARVQAAQTSFLVEELQLC